MAVNSASGARGWDIPGVDILPEDTAFVPSNFDAYEFGKDTLGNISDLASLNTPDNESADKNTVNRLGQSLGQFVSNTGGPILGTLQENILVVAVVIGGAALVFWGVL